MRTWGSLLLLGTFATLAAYGQVGTPNFVVTYNFSDGNLRPVSGGTVITFPAVDINATGTAVITIANAGSGPGLFSGIIVNGDGFQVAGLPLVPTTIAPNQGVRFGITFTPTKAGSFMGAFRIDLSGGSISGSLAGSTAPPNFSLSYVDPRTNNTIALQNGSTLQFPDTPAGSTSNIKI